MSHLGKIVPGGIVAHSIYTAAFAATMSAGFDQAQTSISAGERCEFRCGRTATVCQPAVGAPRWIAVCVADSYDDGHRCPNATVDPLIYRHGLGDRRGSTCPKCQRAAIWCIDYPYSNHDHTAAAEYGVGAEQCLACGWRWGVGADYVPNVATFPYAEYNFPEWVLHLKGFRIGNDDVVHETLREIRADPVGSYLLDVVFSEASTVIDPRTTREPGVNVPNICTTVTCQNFEVAYDFEVCTPSEVGETGSNARNAFLEGWYTNGPSACPFCGTVGAPCGDPFGEKPLSTYTADHILVRG